MLYTFFKYLIKAGLKFYFRKIVFTDNRILHQKGPLLLACNHPNSFLDALLLGAAFDQPVHFLARGDAFKNSFAKKILTALKAIPIYRLSEGKEHLLLNDATFKRCIEILVNGGIVLIFSEGLCQNQWQLRPMKKGTARLALNVWKQEQFTNRFSILPVTLNYSSFTDFRKTVIIDFEEPIFFKEIPEQKNEAGQIAALNKLLFTRLEKGMLSEKDEPEIIRFLVSNLPNVKSGETDAIEILKNKQILLLNLRNKPVFCKVRKAKKTVLHNAYRLPNLIVIILFSFPALAGLIVHLPLYIPLNNFIKRKTRGTVFYHSALFGALIIIYPLYVLLLSVTLIILFKKWFIISVVIILPLSAQTYLVWKDCLESLLNYLKFSRKERIELQQLLQR